MERIEKISQAIPANKFQPPHLAEGQMLQRYEIIQESNIQSVRPRIIYLESQAGQGKTTLALQWLQGNTIPYCWYQVGLEDHDPVLFISAMLVMLSKALPSFDSPDLINQLENGEISLLDLPGCVNLLLQDFATCVNQEIIIVIDDLHLLENAEITISVLDQILNTAPESIRFLLASRRPVPLRTISLPRLPGVLCLNNDHLALSRFQAFELIHDVMQVSVSWPMLEEIHKHTAGWFMGVIIAGHALASGKEQTKFSDSATADEYFRREILAQLPQDMHMPLARLSFLGEIEIPLAEQVTGVDNIGDYLRELMAKNYFVRSLDADNQVFGFHHFFQDFLQQLGREQLEEKAIVDVFSQAAIYSLQQGRLEQALSYYAKGGLYYEIEALLRRDGMQLLARNRNITLCGILATIPEKVIADSSWLSLYLGLARLDLDPEATFPLLAKTMEMFIEQGDEVGELLAGAQILYSHFIFTALYEDGARLLPRIRLLFDEVGDQLPLFARVLVAKNIAMSALIMTGDLELSRHFSDRALELSQRHRIFNFTAATLLARGYEHLLVGENNAAIATAEQAYEFIHHKQVSMINRLALVTFFLNLVDGGLGDSHNYQLYKSFILQEAGADFVNRTLVGSSLVIWDIGIAVAEGALDEARQLLHQFSEHGATGHNPHMQSQFLHWQAYVAAMEGKQSEALEAAEESIRLRSISGSPFFVILNRLILGASYSLLGKWAEAEALLDECGRLCNKHTSLIELCFFHLYTAYLRLQKEGVAAARDDLTIGLSMMRQHNWVYFLSWSPQIMKPLLQTAVQEGIEVDYARKLARLRFSMAILDNGELIPLLSIKILGGCSMMIGDKVICRSDELSPIFRQILSMLFFSRDKCQRLESIQVSLWPDSSPKKARSSMDANISRLRKFLSDRCSPYKVKNYLVVANGMLILQNCRIDALDFMDLARKGLDNSRQGKWWQANNLFTSAMSLWSPGEMGDEFLGTDEAYGVSLQLHSLLAKSVIAWSGHLQQTGRLKIALEVVELAWNKDLTSVELVKVLFGLHLQNKDLARAQNLVRQYADILRRSEYDSDEIKEICNDILEFNY